jgi:hypothetical protein
LKVVLSIYDLRQQLDNKVEEALLGVDQRMRLELVQEVGGSTRRRRHWELLGFGTPPFWALLNISLLLNTLLRSR